MADTSTNGTIELAGNLYMKDARGALIPLENVKPAEKLEDETVRKIIGFARDLSAQTSRFKGHTFADLNALQSLFEQEYGGKAGGKKGNVTFQSYDGLLQVRVQIADQISFGPALQEAKKLIDECLIEWGAESRAEIRALVNRVFAVEKEGQINRAELFGLLRLDIADERWGRAMDAIRDSIRVTGTKAYVRFYERRTVEDRFEPITIDLAAA
jgi:hypothetical protein